MIIWREHGYEDESEDLLREGVKDLRHLEITADVCKKLMDMGARREGGHLVITASMTCGCGYASKIGTICVICDRFIKP